ncbi:hypothetical protein GCK32_021805, partial [Trichostrongylus colubriformis]
SGRLPSTGSTANHEEKKRQAPRPNKTKSASGEEERNIPRKRNTCKKLAPSAADVQEDEPIAADQLQLLNEAQRM